MNEIPNIYLSQQEAKSIIQDIEISYSEGQGGQYSSTVFLKIIKVYPELLSEREWVKEIISKSA